ncbi:inner nuclear membrane protein enriched at telomere/subtelomere region [Coemansia sp. RSA 2599]|nr:inner nuclear membrane protein enriched at telomere/subtelomere region [Coemansia sp. RSA 2598]KAJ1801884.1 inner nuclear membrane protein enriched at telomere/subtelomere region [Coemansia sp. RSA 2599]
MIGSRRYAGYRAEVRAADALVLSALERLKRQARRHYVDPAISPSPAIPSLQLRDLLLLSSASPSSTPAEGGADSAGGRSGYYDPRARASVWERVRKVVERNANVRCRTTAVRGEPMRVWEWIGPLDDDADDEAAAAFGSPFSSPQRLSSPYPSNIAL